MIHMPRKDAESPNHVCPGIRIHAIDIVQPPGIGMPPIADMDAHQATVPAALTANSSVETPRKTRLEIVPAGTEDMGRCSGWMLIRPCVHTRRDGATRETAHCAPWAR